MTPDQMQADVLRCAVYELLDHGFRLSVDSGGEDYVLDRSDDGEAVLGAMMSGDEDFLVVVGRSGRAIGWVHMLYDGSGPGVLCDMTNSVDEYLPETKALIETLKELYPSTGKVAP